MHEPLQSCLFQREIWNNRCIQSGESDRALDVLETMERNGVQPDEVTYGTLMKACEGEGAFSIMRSLMDEMDQRGAFYEKREGY